MAQIDWSPVVTQLAIGIPILVAALATLIKSFAHERQLDQMQRTVNGTHGANMTEIAALRAKIDALHEAEIARLKEPTP